MHRVMVDDYNNEVNKLDHVMFTNSYLSIDWLTDLHAHQATWLAVI